jgi:hypothetical protein
LRRGGRSRVAVSACACAEALEEWDQSREVGQMLSTRPDLLPEDIAEELARLRHA